MTTTKGSVRARPAALRWWAPLGALLAVACVVAVVDYGSAWEERLYVAVVVGAALVAVVGAARAKSRRRFRWLLAGGVAGSGLGDAASYAYQTVFETEPVVSWADLGWLASYGFLTAALLLRVWPHRGDRHDHDKHRARADALVDIATVVTICVMAAWMLSVDAVIGDDSYPALTKAVLVAYPIADAILLALVVRVVATTHSWEPSLALVAAGVTMWLLSDAGYLRSPGDGVLASLLDIGWMVGAVLLALAAGSPTVPTPKRETVAVSYLLSVLLTILPLLVPAFLEVLEDMQEGDSVNVAPVVGMVVLVGLALARMLLLLRAQASAQALLDQSHRRYARLTEASSDVVLVVGEDGEITLGAERLTEAIPGAVEPDDRGDWVDWLRCHAPEDLRAAFARCLAEAGATTTAQAAVGDVDDPVWVEARLVNLLHDPAVEGVVVALSDVTVAKQAAQALELARDEALAASRAKSAFLANMSHEIRTPMNGIIGLTELMLTTSLDARQREYADGVHRAGGVLLSLLNDILDFSKIEAGELHLESIDFSLVDVMEEVGEIAAVAARAKDLEVIVACSPDVPTAFSGDPVRLRQVLLNLASNAVKFSERGDVLIAAREAARHPDGTVEVRLEVRDHGIGISANAAERLFDAFSQADVSTTRRFGGTGLGLAICRELATAMGGRIGVDSEVGVGSTFWVTLPLAPASAPLSAATEQPQDLDRLDGASVLVVDDNDTNRTILVDLLTSWGARPTPVRDAAEALAWLRLGALQDEKADLVLLDLCMPDVDGLELAGRISADETLAGVPMLLLTSGPDVDQDTLARVGVRGRLVKPLRRQRLREAVDAALASVSSTSAVEPGTELDADDATPAARGHLLVVEDNEINQMVALGILDGLGFSADVAANGREGLELVARGSYAAVLMDCQMPEMDGFEATRAIRVMTGPARDVPVIAMTAGAVEGDRERCLEAGMDDYIAKPVRPGELAEALDRWVAAPPAGGVRA